MEEKVQERQGPGSVGPGHGHGKPGHRCRTAGTGRGWKEQGHRGPGLGNEGIRMQETVTVTWRYCDQYVGVQDTDMGD